MSREKIHRVSKRNLAAQTKQRRYHRLRLETLENRRLLAVYDVNSFLDSVDSNPGDGLAQDQLGRTTLRAAIMEANAQPGADTVNLPSGTYFLTLNGSREDAARSGDLDITDSVSIIGVGAANTVIDASNLTIRDRVLHATLGPSPTNRNMIELRGLTITGGLASGTALSDFQDRGGGALLDFYTDVTLVDTIWKNNSAPRTQSGGAFGLGGAISSNAKLSILNSRFENNSATNSGGAIYVGGDTASSVIRNSTFILNSAFGGGAIENHQPMTIDSSTFSQNSGGSVAVGGNGGAINNQQNAMTITNSTISGNQSSFGGGIYNVGPLRISSSTIVNNIGGFGGGLYGNEIVVFENSIIAKNTASFSGPDLQGTASSLGFNLVGNLTGSTGFGANDQTNVDPLIGPLASNGGPTQTHALLAGSPAINAARASTSPVKDQRGVDRPQGSAPDIGAFELIITNRAPVASNDTYSVNEDSLLDVVAPGVIANDNDPDGNTVTSTRVTAPLNGVVTLRPNGSFRYLPKANFNGLDSFTYKLNDGSVDSNVATVFITVNPVNDAPFVDSPTVITNEDTTYNGKVDSVDVEGDTYSILLQSNAAHGVATVNLDGTFSYIPASNFFGTDSFVIAATDTLGASRLGTVTVKVLPVNDAPTAHDDAYAVDEDSPLVLSSIPVSRLTMTSEPGDWVGQGLNYDLSAPASAFSISKNFLNGVDISVSNATQDWSLSFVAAFAAQLTQGRYQNATRYPFQLPSQPGLQVSGNGRGQNELVGEFVVYDVDYNATSISRFAGSFIQQGQPVTGGPLEPPLKGTIRFNSAVGTGAGTAENDVDIDGDLFTTRLVTGPANGTLSLNLDGSLVYTPNPDFAGADTFTYKINDGLADSSIATVTITVKNRNDIPLANSDSASTSEDQAVNINVLANDTDADHDLLTVISATGPTQINADGTITYSPAANFNGLATFSYTVSDGNGGTGTAVVTVSVSAVNDAPDAVNDTASAIEDTPVAISVLNNDFDIDGDVLTILSATGPTTVNADGTITYTPAANYFGTATFTYSVSDSKGGVGSAVVTVTIAAVNDAPIAVNDSATTNTGTPITIAVLQNDSDVDGDLLTVVSATGPTAINANGTITYTPAPLFVGQDTFTYTISDGHGKTATATVTVIVTPVVTTGVVLNNGVLRILGTNQNDEVSIKQQGNSTLRIEASFLPNRLEFPLASVSYIVAHLYGGNDTLDFTGNVSIPSVLDGGTGDDRIKGGDGRDLIIGGLGADRLHGLQSDDILISGTTSYDSNDVALLSLLKEWNSSAPLATRVQNIRNGTGAFLTAGGYKLKKDLTVFDDTSVDEVIGGGGSDWLFFDPKKDSVDLGNADFGN